MPPAVPILAGIGTAITGGAATGGAATAIGGLAAAGAAAGVASSAASLLKKNKSPKIAPAPTFNKNKAEAKAANQAAEASRRRVMAETDTIKTTALGNATPTETKKKTLLGG